MKSQTAEFQMAVKKCENKVKLRQKERDVTQEEIHALLSKLKELVPNMPKNKRLSKLEIIQYVIDYIVDLQIALETHPASRPSVAVAAVGRQPLGLLSPAGNTCSSQEVIHSDKVPVHLDEFVATPSRPVSC